ncbi:GNAT family N-acetyltransferase [Saccharomonospora sp. NPDC006951]
MSTAAVRVATVDDAAEIARIQLTTWQTAYADVLGEKVVETLDIDELTQRWSAAVEHPGTDLLLATEGEFVVGFCIAGPAPESEVAAADGSLPSDAATVGLIATILVEPRWGRRGHGGRLLAAAAAALSARGAERGVTWVVQSDSASLAFFRGAGWQPDATVRTLDTGETTVRELRLTGGLDLKLTEG